MNKFSSRSYTNLKNVHPDLVAVLVTSIINSPYDFTVTNGIRSTEEQKKLYSQGRTAPGNIVTNADGVNNKSNHQAKDDGFGYAVDIYPYYDGKVRTGSDPSERKEVELRLAKIASHILEVAKKLQIKIIWGGDWKMRDTPHFQLVR